MRVYYYYGEIVTIVGKRPDNKVLIRYEDGFEEVVSKTALKAYRIPNRNATKFIENFGSTDRVLAIKLTPCLICGQLPSENAHVVPRSRGGKAKHIVPLCKKHHTELDMMGRSNFESKYNVDLMVEAHKVAEHFNE